MSIAQSLRLNPYLEFTRKAFDRQFVYRTNAYVSYQTFLNKPDMWGKTNACPACSG